MIQNLYNPVAARQELMEKILAKYPDAVFTKPPRILKFNSKLFDYKKFSLKNARASIGNISYGAQTREFGKIVELKPIVIGYMNAYYKWIRLDKNFNDLHEPRLAHILKKLEPMLLRRFTGDHIFALRCADDVILTPKLQEIKDSMVFL
jgi:hypothetical protein